MTEFIKSQISDEIFFKISELENEKNKSKQNKIAKEIISELDIEDFRPYMAYDLEGNAFIALNYYYSHNGIDECLMTGNHDATITEDGIYINDESFLETLKIGYLREELLKEEIKGHLDQKEYDKVSDDLKFYNNHLIELAKYYNESIKSKYFKALFIEK